MMSKLLMTSFFVGISVISSACTEEECRDLIPKQIADGLQSEGYDCKHIELLAWGTVLGMFYDGCVDKLLNDSSYQWHCGQHEYFNGSDLYALCAQGLSEFERRCREQRIPKNARISVQENADIFD